jgi:hypothetical protein
MPKLAMVGEEVVQFDNTIKGLLASYPLIGALRFNGFMVRDAYLLPGDRGS